MKKPQTTKQLKLSQVTVDVEGVCTSPRLNLPRLCRLLLTARASPFALLWLSAPGFSQLPPQPAAGPRDIYSMDLESLLNTTVSTASKFTEKLSDTAAVVTVVTQGRTVEVRRDNAV